MLNVAVLVSGGGTNLQAILDAQQSGEIKNARVVRVIASRADAYALERAKAHGIPGVVVARKAFADGDAFDAAILSELRACRAELVVLAGFMSVLGKSVIDAYPNRILNVHPALIPSFCGRGYYGLRVHEAALSRGVKVTGATVHFVNEEADAGPIILQKAVAVRDDDTPESLQLRVMQQAEWKLLPRAVELVAEGRVTVRENKVFIREEDK